MNQRAHVVATPIPMENHVPPQDLTLVQILVGAPGGGPPPVIHPPIIEIDDHKMLSSVLGPLPCMTPSVHLPMRK